MSRYLNPTNQPKEIWLLDNGLVIPNPYPHFYFELKEEDKRGIVKYAESILNQLEAIGKDNDYEFYDRFCVVDMINNGKFRAAAVYTSRDEIIKNLKEFLDENSSRQHIWFLVSKELAQKEVRDFTL